MKKMKLPKNFSELASDDSEEVDLNKAFLKLEKNSKLFFRHLDMSHKSFKELINKLEDVAANTKNHNNRLSKNEYNYIVFILDLLTDMTSRISYLGKETLHLINKNKIYLSLHLARALIESCWFDFYVTHKLYKLTLTNDVDKFFRLFFKTNFSQLTKDTIDNKEGLTFKQAKSALMDPLVKKIILNSQEYKLIHINDAKKYWQEIKIKEIINNRPMHSFEDLFLKENKKYELLLASNKKTFDKYTKYLLETFKYHKSVTNAVMFAYDRLCTIVHPSSIYFSRHYDKENDPDFKRILIKTLYYKSLHLNNLMITYKKGIFYNILKNKNIYINFIKNYK